MKAFIALAALLLTACGGGGSERLPAGTVTTFGSQQVSVLSGSVAVGSTLEGSGAVLFSQDFGSFKSGKSFALDFTLEDGGSLTLVSHGSSGLANGWEIEFRRQGAGAGSLKAVIRAQGQERDTLNSGGVDVFSAMDASGSLKLQIDVHNNETPAHALVWSRLLSDDFAENAAILNTEENDNSPGIGSGTRWGLKLQNATVSRAEVSEPKFEE